MIRIQNWEVLSSMLNKYQGRYKMKNFSKKLLIGSGLLTSSLLFFGTLSNANVEKTAERLLPVKTLDKDQAQEFKGALDEYLESIKVVADQLKEDAEVIDKLSDKVRARTESVKVYTCWANAYNDYATVLNSYYEMFMSSFLTMKNQTPESFLMKAVNDGKIIQNMDHIEIPFEFRAYIDMRKQNLLDVVNR